jgi:hypothetical protein
MVQNEGAAWGIGATDLGLPSDWQNMNSHTKIAKVNAFLDPRNENSILNMAGDLKTELFDIRKAADLGNTIAGVGAGAASGAGYGAWGGPWAPATVPMSAALGGAIGGVLANTGNLAQEALGWDDMASNQAGIDFIMTNIHEFRILQDYILNEKNIDENLQRAVSTTSGQFGNTTGGLQIPQGSGTP